MVNEKRLNYLNLIDMYERRSADRPTERGP